MSAVRLEFCNVTKQFRTPGQPDVVAVVDVVLHVLDGEVVSLIGPSGCGKSTLLNMAAGLYPVSAGEVKVDGVVVTGPSAHVAFMLQKDLLLPWRTIRSNIEFGLEIQHASAAIRRAQAEKLLGTCRIADFADHYPHQLSGGMRQRAALARTLAVDPSVLLLDEPFSALDAQTKMVLQQDLAETLHVEKKTALFITHDLSEAVALSDRVLVMSRRPGSIIEVINIDIPDRHNPLARRRHVRHAEYVSHLMNLLDIGQMELS